MNIGFTLIILFLIVSHLYPFNLSNWRDISDGIESRRLVDMFITSEGNLVIASENNLYISRDEKWEELFSINGDEKIVDIAVSGKKIFIGTKHKVYAGEIAKGNFLELFSLAREDEIRAIELLSSQKYLYVGANKGLWTIPLNGGGERKILSEIKDVISLRAHPFEPDVIFAGTEEGLYKISKKDTRLLYTSISKTSQRVNSIVVSRSNDDIIFIATDSGLMRMRLKDKEFRELKLNGKLLYVESFETKPEMIVALGERDIFYSQNGLDKWKTLSNVLPYGRLLKILHNHEGKIYLLTDSGIFKSEEEGFSSFSAKQIEEMFLQEPTIEEMEKAVLRAYMLDRNIVKRWRKNSRLRALLPDIDIGVTHGIDRDFDRDVKDTIYTSSSSGKYYIGPDERKLSESYGRDLSYGIKLSWKIGDALFNSSELSVSNEAEDILDFRYRVLSDLRRVYFERRRLIAELHITPQEDDYKKFELKNRIDELTVYLDMLSDGYFSKNIGKQVTN